VKRILLLVAALSAAGSSWAIASASAPAAQSHEGKGHADIYVVRPDGSHKLRLTRAKEDIYYTWPAWRGNANQIAFSGPVCADCRDGLFIVGTDGTGVKRLPIGKLPGDHPTWDPTGRRIAFAGGDGALHVLDLRTGKVLPLTGKSPAHDQPAWSPNGRRITYIVQQPDGRWDIWTVSASGGDRRRLTRSADTEAEPSWSPDSKRIAYTRQVAGRWQLWMMRADGSGQHRITTGLLSDETPTWSPDGRRLAFARVAVNGLYIIDLANGRTTRIRTGVYSSSSPMWSPHGDRIAFVGQPAQH
jgi:Tol biopolymer transport system component